MEKGMLGLSGSNQIYTDGTLKSERWNNENEWLRVFSIHKEFGVQPPEIPFYSSILSRASTINIEYSDGYDIAKIK